MGWGGEDKGEIMFVYIYIYIYIQKEKNSKKKEKWGLVGHKGVYMGEARTEHPKGHFNFWRGERAESRELDPTALSFLLH